jgi:methionyl-tRNA formyltransferase
MKFVFFGTRELAAKVLEALIRAGYSPSLVVTGVDKEAGRKKELKESPVKEVALKHNLSLAQPKNPADLLTRAELKEAELFILSAYGNILPKALVELPPRGVLNVHPSLLPLYRGPAPERFALLEGETTTGVTVILMDEEIDHGAVLAQEEFTIPKDITHEDLHAKLGEIGGELLVRILPLWLEGKIAPKEQDHTKATFTKKVTREDGKIDWNKEAEYIARQIRAFDPWPGTYTLWQGKRIKILKGRAVSMPKEHTSLDPGVIIPVEQEFGVVTLNGVLVVEHLQLEGKNSMAAKDFLLGHKDFLASRLT